MKLVEIRSYALRPGTGVAFHRLVVEKAMPLLAVAGMDVVAFGPSVHDINSYVLIRAFNNLDDLTTSEDALYSSSAWRDGPREAILDNIDTYLDVVVWLDDDTVESIHKSMQTGSVDRT